MKHIQKMDGGAFGHPAFRFGMFVLLHEDINKRLDNFTRKVEHDTAEGRDPRKRWDYLKFRSRVIAARGVPPLDRISAIIASMESEMLWEKTGKGWRQTNLGHAVQKRLENVVADRTEHVVLRSIAHQALAILRIPPT